jgi:hypothetical protein
MPAAPPGDPALARARLRGKRAALGVVILASVAIIGSTAVQVIPAVFGFGIVPVSGPPGTRERACAEGVRRLQVALDRAVGAGAPGDGRTAGGGSFGSRLQPEWNDEAQVFESCRSARQGLDAWAALLRLRSAEEQLALGSRTLEEFRADLEPLRRDVAAHLPADMR